MENKNERQEIRGLGKHNESSMECKRMSKPFKKGRKGKIENDSFVESRWLRGEGNKRERMNKFVQGRGTRWREENKIMVKDVRNGLYMVVKKMIKDKWILVYEELQKL